MLRAALVPLGPNDILTPVSMDYLIAAHGLQVKRLTRQEDVEAALPPVKESTWRTKIAGIGCLAVGNFRAVCTFVGVGDIASWLFRK